LGEGFFKFKRRTIAKGRMQSFTVINAGDEVIDAVRASMMLVKDRAELR
jgi:hypothetical protein